MNYLAILAAYVASFDAEKKEALKAAKLDLSTISEAVSGSDIDADIFKTAFMLTQYATYSEATADNFTEFLRDSVKCTVSVDDYLSYSDEYMDSDGLDEYINMLSPADAFRLGQFSRICWGDEYFILDGYANIQSVSESQIEQDAKDDTGFIESKVEEIKDSCNDYDATAEMIAELATVLVKAGY